MCAENKNQTWMLLLFLSGVLCEYWKVEYQPQHVCTVKGSYVVIGCSFYYPEGERVQTVKWGHEKNHIYDGPFIYDSESVNTSSRFQYIGDKAHNCSLKIHQVQHHDAGKYAFRFITHSTNGQWTGNKGPKLQIVDLRAVVTKTNENRTMMEGDSVNLTCINSCDGGDFSSAFTWFKDGEPINEGPVLYLSNISFINSGNYTCSLTTHEGTTSGVININVEYGPKDTSVSPLMEVDAGSNISLTCSSHANPPVEEYTWFKMYDDEIWTIGDEPELHLMEVSPDDDGQYFCSATNKHGSQNSSTETLKVNENLPDSTVTSDVFIIATAAVVTTVTLLLIVTAVIVIRGCNKNRTRAPETVCEEKMQNAVYVNWSVFDNSQSHEGNLCEGATMEVIYTAVDFNTKRESNMQQQMDSCNDDEGVIYSTVCRDQILNPSYIEHL